jgi:hypothetical protein
MAEYAHASMGTAAIIAKWHHYRAVLYSTTAMTPHANAAGATAATAVAPHATPWVGAAGHIMAGPTDGVIKAVDVYPTDGAIKAVDALLKRCSCLSETSPACTTYTTAAASA